MTSYLPLVQSVPIASSIWENVYSEESNTRHARTPVINSQVIKSDLNSKSFRGGAQIQVELPQGPLLTHAMLALKIAKADIPDKAYLRQGWGYKCIRNYEIRTGGQTNLRIYGRQLQTKALSDCETVEKRSRMLELGGKEYLGVQADIPGDYLTAYVHIYLPFSNLSASKFLPYDSGILNKPISLLFEFESAENVFTYSSTDAAVVKAALPTEFVSNYFMIQTALMALGPAESIRPDVGPNGDAQYNYGWMYPSAFVSSEFVGRAPSDGSVQVVRLEQFPNGSLQSMDLYLERMTTGSDPDVRLKDCPNNEILYEDLSNIEVRYGGQVIYRSDDESNKLMSLSEYTTSNVVNINFPNLGTGAVGGTITTNTSTTTWVHVQLTQFNDQNGLFKNLVQDGVSAVNNMMEVRFNTPEITELSNGTPGGVPLPEALTQQPIYRLHANYNYQVSMNTWKGFTDQMFLPANAQGPFTMAS